ncbi:MAG: sulfite exporter TauE/SafE family protein [Patescibacteria group bacterium]
MSHITLFVVNTHCASCETRIESGITAVPGVERVNADSASGRVDIWFSGVTPNTAEYTRVIEGLGYAMGKKEKLPWFSRSTHDYIHLFVAIGIVALLYVVGTFFNIESLSLFVGKTSISMALVLGLIAGISTCSATVGGLVLALSARNAELHPEATGIQRFRPHLFFNLGRLIGFAGLGGLLGVFGAVLQPSIRFSSGVMFFVGIVMVLLGLKLIEVFPRLTRIPFTLPKRLLRTLGISYSAHEYSHRGAFLSGVFTFFLPCGFTQAMQFFAIGTGSFVSGALAMFLFALGTAPGLLGIASFSAFLKGRVAKLFFVVSGIIVFIFGYTNIRNASTILFAPSVNETGEMQDGTRVMRAEYRVISGLSPRTFAVNTGERVAIEIYSHEDDYGCMGTILIPGLFEDVQFLKKDTTILLPFTATRAGEYAITCAMGLRHGTITVTE